MVATQIVWHGSEQEKSLLLKAIQANCSCEFGPMGVRVSTCAPHEALLRDQRFLDHLVAERRYWLVRHGDTEG